jgi:glycogen debranching enzyme
MDSDRQLLFLRELEEENARISGHPLPIGYGLWGIHGLIAVDGDVLMAEFDSYDEARRVLDALSRERR